MISYNVIVSHVTVTQLCVTTKEYRRFWNNDIILLQLQDLKVDQVKRSCIRLIQENSELDKVPSTKYLPYILH